MTKISTAELDTGMCIEHPETGDRVMVLDYARPTGYGPGVYELADPETHEHRDLLVTDADHSDTVECV